VKQTARKPKIVQSDNGSCCISAEYRSFIDKSGMEHRKIHPHCPNENAEIERYYRTLRELADPLEVDDYTTLLEFVKQRIRFSNFERYHSAIGYVTPYAWDSGKAEVILASRKRKMQKAKERLIKANFERIEKEKLFQHRKAA